MFADIEVKHSAPLSADRSLRAGFSDAIERGLADAVIVSGPATGDPIAPESLTAARNARTDRDLDVPILVGSGVDIDSAEALLEDADGAIVGTALKQGGETAVPVSEKQVRALVDSVRSVGE